MVNMRIYDWDTTLQVEEKWHKVHLYMTDRNNETHIELDKKQVKELIEMLEKAIR